MTVALYLLAILGVIGAFDTLYYHEWKARLPARRSAALELKLHAARDFLYAVLFGTLPWVEWHGLWVGAVIGVATAEIGLTLTDFVVEIRARKSLGDVYAGERVTHAVMGIVYGAILTQLVPVFGVWRSLPSALVAARPMAPEWLRQLLLLMAAGVLLSGLRDLYAAFGLPRGDWPWGRARRTPGSDGLRE